MSDLEYVGDFFEAQIVPEWSTGLLFVRLRFIVRVHYFSGAVYDWCYFINMAVIEPPIHLFRYFEMIFERIRWNSARGLFLRSPDDAHPKSVRRVELLPWKAPEGGFKWAPTHR